MILEAIVTTISPGGELNIAPMGPRVETGNELQRFVLRPYQTSTTYRNLTHLPEGVLQVTDDVWLLAQAAVGEVNPPPEMFPAKVVRGQVLAETCRWYEFRVTRLQDHEQRTTIECEIVHTERLRDFFGFNRAKHAVVEAAILATRTDFLPIAEILGDFDRLSVLVQKTGGEQEHLAFQFLLDHVKRVATQKGHLAVRS